MSVQRIEVLVEEPSMETLLRTLLPKIIRETSFGVYPYQCKQDLLAKLPDRLRGYRSWMPNDWRIVVIVDRDDDKCLQLKTVLEAAASKAGFTTRSRAKNGNYDVANRIAIEELEAWYFGDWDAVRAAFPRANASVPTQAKYRNPDAIKGGTWEAFERILKTAGYFRGGLRKNEAARLIAANMNPARNTSRSFCAFRDVLVESVGK